MHVRTKFAHEHSNNHAFDVSLSSFVESGKAFNTRFVSLALNSYLLSSTCYFSNSFVIGTFTKYSLRFEPLDKLNSNETLQVEWAMIAGYYSKIQSESSFIIEMIQI